MDPLRFTPWSGSSGIIETVVLVPPAPVNGVLAAAAQSASFGAAATVAGASPVNGVLAAAAQSATFSGAGTVASGAGVNGVLAAVAGSAAFAGSAALIAPALMPAGDSLQVGSNSTGTVGWRKDAGYYIQNNGLGIDIVGQFNSGTMPDADHNARSGAASATIKQDFLDALTAGMKPRLTDVDMGINDVHNNGVSGVTAAATVNTNLRAMHAAAVAVNAAHQFVLNLMGPIQPGTLGDDQWSAFNTEWTKAGGFRDTWNTNFPSNKIELFDVPAALGGSWDTTLYGGDPIHWAEPGWALLRAAKMVLLRTSSIVNLRGIRASLNALGCTITAPTAGATLTVGVAATLTATVTRSGLDTTVRFKNTAGTVIATATPDQYTGIATASYTPVTGDIGSFTVNATVTDNLDSSTANATGVAVTVAAAAPASAIAALPLRTFLFSLKGSLGIVEAGGAGTGVTTWTDQSPAGKNAVQAGASTLRPTIQASNAAFNNKQTLRFTKANSQTLNLSTLNLPAPGTTPFIIFMVFRVISWATGQVLIGNNTSNCYVKAITAAPQMFANWGTLSASNSGAGTPNTVGALMRLELGNSVNDLFRIGSTQLTGSINLNNTDAPAGLGICAASNGTLPADAEVAEVWAVQGGTLSAQEISDVNAYVATEYGATILL